MEIYCHHENVEYEYLTNLMTADYINNNFDLILWPLANCFCASKTILGYLRDYTRRLKDYHIPVLALGAGAQADTYNDIDLLTEAIKQTAKDFIDGVHATGGVFGLRGYFTKELFERLGYKDDIVIGCPSAYQFGRNLRIDKIHLDERNVRLALNGNCISMREYRLNNLYIKFPNSWFIDQGEYISLLYDEVKKEIRIRDIKELMIEKSRLGIEMLVDGRIVCIYDLPRLAAYIKELGINLAFGQRIHGNLLCTILGIPSIVHIRDSRTKELAEYFNLPTFLTENEKIDILEIYEKADWNKFNNNFKYQYDSFEKLLCRYGMPKISEINYTFMSNVERYKMPGKVNEYSYLKDILQKEFLWRHIY